MPSVITGDPPVDGMIDVGHMEPVAPLSRHADRSSLTWRTVQSPAVDRPFSPHFSVVCMNDTVAIRWVSDHCPVVLRPVNRPVAGINGCGVQAHAIGDRLLRQTPGRRIEIGPGSLLTHALIPELPNGRARKQCERAANVKISCKFH